MNEHRLPPSPQIQTLRAEAETRLANACVERRAGWCPERLLHELQVHEIELEMQNESLRLAQEAQQELLDRYVVLFDFAPVGYLTLTDSGLIAEANLTVASMLGVERDQLLNCPFDQYIVPSDRQRWQSHRSSALGKDENESLDLLFWRADHEAVVGHLDCRRQQGADGCLTLFISIADITDWKRVEDALSKSEAFSRDILDSVPSEIAVLDRDGIIISVNSAWQRFAEENGVDQSCPAPKIGVGANYLAVCETATGRFSEGALAVRNGIGAVLSGCLRGFSHEYACHWGDDQRWFSMSVTPISLNGYGAVIAHTDITERKLAELQLQVNERRLRLAKEAANLGVFDHGIADGTHEWDSRARELWGFSPTEEMTFEKFMAGVHPDDRAATQAAVDRALDPMESGEYLAEYRVINRQDGTVRHVVANGRVSLIDGRPVRFTGTIKDVSEQKKLEMAARERRSEMELLVNQQVAAHTAAAIAHELNQPLVAVSAYSEAALRMLSETMVNRERLTHALNGAVDQVQRAGQTLHELLAFLHRGETESEPVDINKVVLEALSLAAEGGYADFRQIIELEQGLRPVLANRLQLQKVLVILFQNSVDAMRGAGVSEASITISVRTTGGGSLAHVTVHDSGPGLDPETVHRIFEPFFTTKPDGIGLGLAISRALIEAHGGQLWAEVDSGPGATFHFTLPFAP
ncbi:MAG: PAS domain S-box protein [Azonexus sp.]